MSKHRLRVAALIASMTACACLPAMASATDATPAPAAAAVIPVRDFARHALVSSPRLSPDGTYLAVRVDSPDGYQHGLAIYELSDMHVASLLHMPKYQVPLNMTWVSPTWLVVEKGRNFGSLDAPMSTGEIIATDVTGDHQRYIYGYKQVGRRAATRADDHGFGSIAGLPPKANGHFYFAAQPWDREELSMLYEANAQHNTRHLIADLDEAQMSFLVDPDGKAQLAFGTNADFEYVVYHHRAGGWAKLDPQRTGREFLPLAYAPDAKRIYAWWSPTGGPLQLVEQDINGDNRQILASNEFADVDDLQWTPPPRQPFATMADTGIPTPVFIDPDLPAAKLYRALQKAFPGEFVDFIDFSEDGGKLLFSVSSDRDPGTYYLLDTHTHKATKLFPVQPWIKPARMAERRPFRFKARDGMRLDGYLTLPPQRGETNLPMVLLPHGGPHGVRDEWFYDADAQFLASRGYLVLQVNFRGSGDRGLDFTQAGYGQWGTGIQQDLIDGVHWAIDHKLADPGRICVFGGSFGAYSALMTVIRAPQLFQCAIGNAGIYDLSMMYDKGDIRTSQWGRSYLASVIGKDQATLDANSPAKLADKITVPVFLAHGKADERAPFDQAEAMRDALEAAHKPYEWMAVPKEGHGFYTEKHRAEFLTRVQAFLEKYIGPGAPRQPKVPPQA